MRNSLIICLIAAAGFFFSGCSEDSPTNNGNNNVPTDFSFSVKINGATWKADTAVYRTPALPTSTKEIVAWIGEEGLGEKITISLQQTTPGAYAVEKTGAQIGIQYTPDLDPGTTFSPGSAQATEGTFTIVESNDQFISGTFSFKGEEKFSNPKVTYQGIEGTFKVKAE